jgi:hypothetical protein
VRFESEISLFHQVLQMKIVGPLLLSVISSYTRKGTQLSINQELRREPNQIWSGMQIRNNLMQIIFSNRNKKPNILRKIINSETKMNC